MMSRVVVVDSCWEWVGGLSGSGYGRFSDGVRQIQAHRLMYELRKGPIPAGLTIDHLCRNRRCVNPDHLEPVTNKTNLLRGMSPIARAARSPDCLNGHPLSGDNLLIDADGCRRCRQCRQVGRRDFRYVCAGRVRGFKKPKLGCIHLRCPRCGRKQSNVGRHPEYDHPTAFLLEIPCENCSMGCKIDGGHYYDRRGRRLSNHAFYERRRGGRDGRN